MTTDSGAIGIIGTIAGVTLGWLGGIFSRTVEERLFGANLVIDCPASHKGENENDVFIKVRIRNTRKRLAKSCRVYLVGLQQVMDGHVIGTPKLHDSFQLPWAGWSFSPRDVPYGVSQFVDIIRFPKHTPEKWAFSTEPSFYRSLENLADYRGTYRFTILVTADGSRPNVVDVDVLYNGIWQQVTARKV